ncbi:carboxy terminal-processing peptidase [Blattabacterium cuenoti]|uniref:carboxy terminal-processing peptidase n=1 Tax=Blattabacterium cuenoti TaxID=1653831 RepID=UPI00163B7D18|nr:carboxy terminal-processing peptidase [Blattabacterium cuenoti]
MLHNFIPFLHKKYNFFKIRYIIIICSCLILLNFCYKYKKEKQLEDNQHLILQIIYKTLSILHFNPIKIDNNFSIKVYNNYLNNLDDNKLFFIQKDLNYLSFYKDKLDEFWKNGDPTFFNVSIKCFYNKINKIDKFCSKILKYPFNFEQKEIFRFENEKISYPKDVNDLENKWRKYLKYLAMIKIFETINPKIDYSLNDIKNIFQKNEEWSRKKVKEDIQEYFRKLKIQTVEDWFSKYVNIMTKLYDPHTNYFSTKEKDEFDSNISGSLDGIGAELKDDKGYATVVNIIHGGPAWKSKKIEIGDKIIRVSKNLNSPSKNIIGMLLENSIRLIKGKKNTKVKLTILKKNGLVKEVILTRDTIKKEDTFAKYAIILDNNKKKYGLIYLPEFYFNPDNKHDRTSARDIKKIIKYLKTKKIKHLILDIRNNGGGSLDDVVKIAGYFLGKTPIVQIGFSNGKTRIIKSYEKNILWKGPLIIISNEFSASASEILAASIKDYKRGIIVGSKQTYGKGTVQMFYPLKSFCLQNLGSLKVTINKFYRVNGCSPQKKGVKSDIVIPIPFNHSLKMIEIEREINKEKQDNTIKWDCIPPVSHNFWKYPINIQKIKLKSMQRFKKYTNIINHYNKLLNLYSQYFLNKQYISLNWKDFYNENIKIEKINNDLQKLNNYINYHLSSIYNNVNYKIINSKEPKLCKKLLKDIYIEESIHIFQDIDKIQHNKKKHK